MLLMKSLLEDQRVRNYAVLLVTPNRAIAERIKGELESLQLCEGQETLHLVETGETGGELYEVRWRFRGRRPGRDRFLRALYLAEGMLKGIRISKWIRGVDSGVG